MKKENLHADFKAMKKELGLTNADIADIIGLSVDSVKTMTQPSKGLPSWAKAMIYVWKHVSKYHFPQFIFLIVCTSVAACERW